MTNPDYLWRPDPKGEELPQTLFGIPITFSDDLPKDFVVVLGTLDEYVVRRRICGLDELLPPLTKEQWDFLLERAKGPKHPEVVVEFTNLEADRTEIIGQVVVALTRAGIKQEELGEFFREAVKSDNVIQTCTEWVTLV